MLCSLHLLNRRSSCSVFLLLFCCSVGVLPLGCSSVATLVRVGLSTGPVDVVACLLLVGEWFSSAWLSTLSKTKTQLVVFRSGANNHGDCLSVGGSLRRAHSSVLSPLIIDAGDGSCLQAHVECLKLDQLALSTCVALLHVASMMRSSPAHCVSRVP